MSLLRDPSIGHPHLNAFFNRRSLQRDLRSLSSIGGNGGRHNASGLYAKRSPLIRNVRPDLHAQRMGEGALLDEADREGAAKKFYSISFPPLCFIVYSKPIIAGTNYVGHSNYSLTLIALSN